MSRELWGYLIWGSIFAAVAVPELVAAFCKVPFPTISETSWNLIQRTNGWAAIAFVAGLAVLLIHIVLPDTFNPKKRQ